MFSTYLILNILFRMWCFILIAKIINPNDTALFPNISQCQFNHFASPIRSYFQCIDVNILWFRFLFCGNNKLKRMNNRKIGPRESINTKHFLRSWKKKNKTLKFYIKIAQFIIFHNKWPLISDSICHDFHCKRSTNFLFTVAT